MEGKTMTSFTFDVPKSIRFSELHLRMEDGSVHYEWEPVASICAQSNIPEADVALGCGSIVPLLIYGWLHQALPGEVTKQERREAQRIVESLLSPILRRRRGVLAQVTVRRVGPLPTVH